MIRNNSKLKKSEIIPLKLPKLIKEQEPNCTHSVKRFETLVPRYILSINDFDNLDDPSVIDKLIESLEEQADSSDLEVRISSYGGSVEELFKIQNAIGNLFYGRITTVLNSFGYSAGAFLFLEGDQRVIFENSQIMFHDVSLGVFGKHSDIKVQTEFNERFFNNIITRYLKMYFSKSEIDEILNGKEFWLDALEMAKREICTNVQIFGISMTAKTYVEYKTNAKKRVEILEKILEDYDVSPKYEKIIKMEIDEANAELKDIKPKITKKVSKIQKQSK